MTLKSKKFTIIISSCDKYSDLWLPMGNLYKKYWKNCNNNIYLLTESLNFKKKTKLNTEIKTINVKSKSWSKRLKVALKSKIIKEKNILFVLDDFFLQSEVSNRKIGHYFYQFKKFKMEMLRIVARPGPLKKNKLMNNIGKINNNENYAISTQAAFWQKTSLISHLNDKENIWQFEINGSKRVRQKKINFFGVYKDILPYKHHVVERGKWFPWYYIKFKNMDIGVSNKREVMSFFESIFWIFKKYVLCYPKKFFKFLVNIVR